MLTAVPLIVSDTPVRAIAVDATTFDDLDLSWNGSDDLFVDSTWAVTSGAPNGAGYDANTPPVLDSFIGVDLESTMLSSTNTMYVRIPFEVADASVLQQANSKLTLNLRHDAGYIVYLNGAEVARGLIPDDTPPWDALGTANTTPTPATGPSTFEQIDLGEFTNLLKDGTNILAIRSANEEISGNNVLIQAELTGDDGNPLAIDDSFETNQGDAVANFDILANDETGSGGNAFDPTTVILTSGTSDGPNAITTAAGNRVEVNPDGTINFIPTSDYAGDDSFTYTVEYTAISLSSEIIVAENADTSIFIPTDATLANTWTGEAEPFDDSAWTTGKLGVGYATATGDAYDEFIGLELGATLRNVNGSIYIRVPFDLEVAPTSIQTLTLRMRYDDAFVAYLNGEEIARSDFIGPPAWDSLSPTNNTDAEAIVFEDFDVTPFIDKLTAGANILSFQGINKTLASSDLLIQPQLVADTEQFDQVSSEATVDVHVNAKPDTSPDTATVGFESTIIIPVLSNDIDPDNSPGGPGGATGIDPSTVEIVTDPSIGTAIAGFDGTVTYSSAGAVLRETISFTYRVQDYEGAWSDPQTVKVSIDIDPPNATDDFEVTARDESIDIYILASVEDTPGDFAINKLSVRLDPATDAAANGSVLVVPVSTPSGSTNIIRYLPNPGFVGRDTFAYTVADIHGNRSAPAIVTVDVYERAIASDNIFTAEIDQQLVVGVSELTSDDFIPANYQASVRIGNGDTVTTTAKGGTVNFNGSSFTYTPPAGGFAGVDSFEYVLFDSAPAQPPLPLRPKADSNSALIEIVGGPITVEGFVYVDVNQNGNLDQDEYRIADSIITLTKPDDPSLRVVTTTDSNGFYRFESSVEGVLASGTYTITQTQPSMFLDFLPTSVNQHANVEFLSGATSATSGFFNFREWSVNPQFFTTISDYGAGFVASSQQLNMQAGSLVVPYDGGWDGSFVVQTSYDEANGSVNISLLDAQGNELTSAQSNDGQGPSQLLWNATSGQPLVLVVSGNNSAVSVEVPNLGQLTGDTSAPAVVDVLVSSTEWTAAVLGTLSENGLGDGGYSLWNQTPLPWTNLDQITVRFSEDVDVDSGDLRLWGLSISDYVGAGQVSGFAYDSATQTAVWTLAESLDLDRLQIGIDGSVDDLVGNRLINANFNMSAEVHPGSTGVRPILTRFGAVVGDARYQIMSDLNGDGQITLLDVLAARRGSQTDLPVGSPGPASTGAQAPSALVQNTAQLSGDGVDAAIVSVITRSRRQSALPVRRTQVNVAGTRSIRRSAAVDRILSQSTSQTRRTLSAGLARLSQRAHRSMRLSQDVGDEAASDK